MSVQELAGRRHRLRWRELEPDGRRVSQSWTVHGTPQDAERWALRVYEAIRAGGAFQRPAGAAACPQQPVRPVVADLRELHVTYAEWKALNRGLRPSTVANLRGAMERAEAEICSLEGIPTDSPIPVSVLSVELCTRILRRLADGPPPEEIAAARAGASAEEGSAPRPAYRPRMTKVGPERRRKILAAVWEAWRHGADEPDRWPGLPPAPSDKGKVVPRLRRRSRPDPAPTVAEMDALVRGARASPGPLLAEFLEVQRATGLRAFQVCELRADDLVGLDSPVPRLAVRVGKSAQEAEGRIVPVAPVLVPTLRRLSRDVPADGRLLRRKGQISPNTLHALFGAVEDAGELRPVVWRSARRQNRRTTHTMRAGFQRMMRRLGIEDRVIDVLVGHAGQSTRDRHYDDADWSELVEAVRLVPAVDWSPVAAKVVELPRRG